MSDSRSFYELTPGERRADFAAKNALLRARFSQIAPLAFYEDFLFHAMDTEVYSPSIILYEAKGEEEEHRWKRQAVELSELMDYADRNDVAINPCAYWNNYPRKKLMRQVYAFVMDIDEVRPSTLQMLLSMIDRGEFPCPTAITNSGSGIHFFYILDTALEVGYREKYLQNFRLAEQVYFMLHSRMKRLYNGVQRHHIGQDYRLVGSLTKYGDTATAWEVGGLWSIEGLADAVGVDIAEIYKPMIIASPKMAAYARSIAKTLGLELPDLSSPRDVFDFIAENKDAAYQERQRRREAKGEKSGRKKTFGWYRDTWYRVWNHTEVGNRFNAMRGLAIVAYKCGVPEDVFEKDLEMLSNLWQEQRWHGDPFNPKNVEAIMRLYRNGERYKKTSRARLEELFGWKWTGSYKKIRVNGRSQIDHLKRARAIQTVDYPNGEWRNKAGAPTAERKVREWQQAHPDGSKAACIRDTGLSKPTVYKWWSVQ